MAHNSRTILASTLTFLAALAVVESGGCDARRASAEETGVKAARPQRETGGAVGIKLDQTNSTKGLNGSYSDGQRTLRFETMRQPVDRRGVQPPLERDHYIALRVVDSTGRTLVLMSEDGIPGQWLREAEPAPDRLQPVEPEVFRLALEAAQAVKQITLPPGVQAEQALLAQQLADFGSRPSPAPLRQPPGEGSP
jgi:hypothetical protein